MAGTVEVKERFKDNFEGLADVTRLSKDEEASYFDNKDPGSNERYCVVSGRYRVGKDKEEVAIAIGLWDEKKGCFSVFKKTKAGKSLPRPFAVQKGKDKIKVARRIIINLSKVAPAGFEKVLQLYNQLAQKHR